MSSKKDKSKHKDKGKKSKSKGSKKRSKEPKLDKPTTALKKEYEAWLDSGEETAKLEWHKCDLTDQMIYFRFGKAEIFTVTYPDDYPDTEQNFFVYSEDETMDDWCNRMLEVCDKPAKTRPPMSLAALLTSAADIYLNHGPQHDDSDDEYDDDEFGEFGDEEDGWFEDEIKNSEKSEKKEKAEPIDMNKYLQIGSTSATLRLIKDLRNIQKEDTKELGFSAMPTVHNGKENLYHWEIRLFFDKDSTLGKDLQKLKKARGGKDYVHVEMRFSKDYPFIPPFVRVVEPRFQFRTGHVTIGGSICMELLTNTGWRSTNDIESIIIQIRAELLGGGARLDSSNKGPYSENEAWDAYRRAARTHGWDIKNLGPQMFPKLT